MKTLKNLLSVSIIVSRILLLEKLHFCIDDVLKPLADAALVRIRVQTSNLKRFQMHIVTGSYVCDNPDSEDLLEVRRGNQTNCQ